MSHPNGSPDPFSPTPAEIAAAILFLADDDPRMQSSARDRLLRWGTQAQPALREAAESDNIRIRARARTLLRSLEIREHLLAVAALRLDVRGAQSAVTLLRGAVHLGDIVRTFGPSWRELGSVLRAKATALKPKFADRTLTACARMLSECLHGELGLRGLESATNPVVLIDGLGQVSRSSFGMQHVLADQVLANGNGVPVALALLYLLVARFAGLQAYGVAMPDHFLVRLHGIRPVLIDPAHEGRVVTKTDCMRHLRRTGHEAVQELLRDVTDRVFLTHYLRALQQGAANAIGHEARRTLGQALQLLESR